MEDNKGNMFEYTSLLMLNSSPDMFSTLEERASKFNVNGFNKYLKKVDISYLNEVYYNNDITISQKQMLKELFSDVFQSKLKILGVEELIKEIASKKEMKEVYKENFFPLLSSEEIENHKDLLIEEHPYLYERKKSFVIDENIIKEYKFDFGFILKNMGFSKRMVNEGFFEFMDTLIKRLFDNELNKFQFNTNNAIRSKYIKSEDIYVLSIMLGNEVGKKNTYNENLIEIINNINKNLGKVIYENYASIDWVDSFVNLNKNNMIEMADRVANMLILTEKLGEEKVKKEKLSRKL